MRQKRSRRNSQFVKEGSESQESFLFFHFFQFESKCHRPGTSFSFRKDNVVQHLKTTGITQGNSIINYKGCIYITENRERKVYNEKQQKEGERNT
ncbi:MAG: hypothetical protein AYK18_00920 [Theionarchaea archaeon DG-70]|nr:MAG: hypothetical protein AYK18_00920 [Theionarchaea archaeon DG-70]